MPEAGRRRDASLPIRVASAALLAPLFLAAAWVGGAVWFAVVAALAVAGGWEFGRFALPSSAPARALVIAGALGAVALRFAAPGGAAPLAALVTVLVLAALTVGLAGADPTQGTLTAALALLGSLYAGWLFAFLVSLRELPRELGGASYRDGFVLVLVPVLLVWVTDVGAYFAGRAWGRRRLLPRVSPGKTVAGAVGGAAAAASLAVLLFGWAPAPLPPLGPVASAAVGLAGSLLAQVGDLAESLLKRAFGVKDSSRLIPGHGGVLDRFDSLLFAAPALYYFFRVALE